MPTPGASYRDLMTKLAQKPLVQIPNPYNPVTPVGMQNLTPSVPGQIPNSYQPNLAPSQNDADLLNVYAMLFGNNQKSQDEIDRERQRLAGVSAVNTVGQGIKAINDALSALNGVPIRPDNGQANQQVQQQLARLREQQTQEYNKQNQANLQMVMSQYQAKLKDKDYNRALADEKAKNEQNFKNNKVLYGVKSDAQIALENQKAQNRSQFWDNTLSDKENLAILAGKIRSGQIDQQGNIQSGLINQRGEVQKGVNAEKPLTAEKNRKAKTYIKDANGNSVPIMEEDYYPMIANLQGIKNIPDVKELDKHGNPTGNWLPADKRYEGIKHFDLSKPEEQKAALHKYGKYLQENTNKQTVNPGVMPSGTETPTLNPQPGAKKGGMTLQGFAKGLDATMADPIFQNSDKSGHIKQLTGIAMRFKTKVPEFVNMTQAQIEEMIQAYYDQYNSATKK